MKTQLEEHDIQAIATAVTEMLKPLFTGNGRHEADDTIMTIIKAIIDYLIGGAHESNNYSYRQRNNVFAKNDRRT